MKSKKGAMEMSVGTIVTIVLLMSVLVLGLVLIKNILGGAMDIVDMTNEQMENQVNKLFGEDKDLVVLPASREVKIKHEEQDAFGIGIKNNLKGVSGTKTFSYETVVADVGDCGIEESEIKTWIISGADSNIPIAVGKIAVDKVFVKIPAGAPFCTFKLRVNVNAEETSYATDSVFIEIK